MINNIIENLLEKGVESVGEQAKNTTFQRIATVIVFLCSAWITIDSAFLWQAHQFPGTSGLIQLVESGRGPLWLLLAPIFGALVVILTPIPLTGRFSVIGLFSAVILFSDLGAFAYIQGNSASDARLIDVTSVLAVIVLPIFTMALMITDIPTLDSPMARFAFVYSGRLRHLRALRQFGAAHDWQVKEPQNRDNSLTVIGNRDPEHTITITSKAIYKLSTSDSFTLLLTIKETSPYDIIAFRISYDDIPANLRKRAIAGECRQRLKRSIKYFIIPEPGQLIEDSFAKRFADIVEAGRPFLKSFDFVVATPFGLRYTHKTTGLTRKDVQRLDALLPWLHALVSILEEISPRGTHQPTAPMPPQQ